MKKLLYFLSGIVLAMIVFGCRSREDNAEARVVANKEKICQILLATGRPGMESVISHLDTTDFFTRGGGGHHTEAGGLAQHSLEVYGIMRCIAWFQRSDSIAITALMHDMGKIDTGGWHPWRSVKHLGEWGVKLTNQEYIAIFFHHKRGLKNYRFPLRFDLSLADAISTGWWKLWHESPPEPLEESSETVSD